MGHWHVGHNLPGCLPESNILCFGDAAQAAAAFRDELRRAIDELPQESQVSGMDGEFLKHDTWLHLNGESYVVDQVKALGGVWREVSDGRALPVVYWIETAEGEPVGCDWYEADHHAAVTERPGAAGAAASVRTGGR